VPGQEVSCLKLRSIVGTRLYCGPTPYFVLSFRAERVFRGVRNRASVIQKPVDLGWLAFDGFVSGEEWEFVAGGVAFPVAGVEAGECAEGDGGGEAALDR
jgi:hypothetical protein